MQKHEQASSTSKLYIPSQPLIAPESINMQSYYSSRDHNDVLLEEVAAKRVEEVENEVISKQVEHVRGKSIHSMTKVEKIQYLINKPKYIPNIPCLFLTSTDTFIGYVREQMDEKLIIDLTNDFKKITLKIDEILEIHPYVKNK